MFVPSRAGSGKYVVQKTSGGAELTRPYEGWGTALQAGNQM